MMPQHQSWSLFSRCDKIIFFSTSCMGRTKHMNASLITLKLLHWILIIHNSSKRKYFVICICIWICILSLGLAAEQSVNISQNPTLFILTKHPIHLIVNCRFLSRLWLCCCFIFNLRKATWLFDVVWSVCSRYW